MLLTLPLFIGPVLSLYLVYYLFYPVTPKKSPLRSVEVGTAKPGETVPRRWAAHPELVTSWDDIETVPELLAQAAERFGSRPALGVRRTIKVEEKKSTSVVDGKEVERVLKTPWLSEYEWRSYTQMFDEIKRFGAGLTTYELKQGQRVALFAATRPEWQIAAQGCFQQGLPVVTVYPSLGLDALAYSLNQTHVQHIITQADKLDLVIQCAAIVSSLKYVVFFDELSNAKRSEYEAKSRLKFVSYAQVLTAGTQPANSRPALPLIKGDDMAVIMYTSGSTGNPKGVLMTHKNLLAAARAVTYVPPEPLNEQDVYIAFLPLAHVLELCAETLFLALGAKVGYGTPLTLMETGAKNAEGKPAGDLSVLRPTVMAAVPLVLDRMKAGVMDQVGKSGLIAKSVFNTAYYLKQRNWMRKQSSPILDRLIFGKVKAKLGGRVRYLLSGGAPLSKDTQAFISVVFCAPVLQGYGLTETLAANCICLTGDHRVLTRKGWQSITEVTTADEVMSFNTNTYETEWKAVVAVPSHAIDPSNDDDKLYRMEGSGMDIVATRNHRMLVGVLNKQSSTGMVRTQPVRYETVEQLLQLTYKPSTLSPVTSFQHNQMRAVIRAGHNAQPGKKIVIEGMEQVCEWWWLKDGQRDFLNFLGFWVGDGYLQPESGRLCISQREDKAVKWLDALLLNVFPPGFRRRDYNKQLNCWVDTVICPPLYNFLRLMAVGPAGYNPRDVTHTRSYPHFAYDARLATEEAKTDYSMPNTSHGYESRWSEVKMLKRFIAKSAAVPESCWWCGGVERADGNPLVLCDGEGCQRAGHLECAGLTDVPAEDWLCPCCEHFAPYVAAAMDDDVDDDDESKDEDEDDGEEEEEEVLDVEAVDEEGVVVRVSRAKAVEDEKHDEAVGEAMRAAGAIVWWNNGGWIIIGGHWFYLKRWLGDQQLIADVYSQLSRQQAIALLDGFCRADGTWASIEYVKDKYGQDTTEPTGQWECSSSSFPLIDHLQLIGQLTGAAVTLSLVNKAGESRSVDGATVRFSVDHWRLRFLFSKSKRGIPFPTAPLAGPVDVSNNRAARGHYDGSKDDGRVYCLTVASNGDATTNFLVERLVDRHSQSRKLGVTAFPVFVGNCHPDDVQPGNVGAPIPSCEIKLVDVPEMGYHSTDKDKDGKPAPRGEIVIRGGCVAPGYFDLPTQTAEVFEKGKGKGDEALSWFHSGDIGQWREDGTLSIIDRKKDLVKLAHGEYIALGNLESIYAHSPLVQNICIYADADHQRPIAIVVPSKAVGTGSALQAAAARESVVADLNKYAAQKKLEKWERIAAVYLTDDEWTPQSGMLTEAMKLKRHEIKKKYAKQIEETYKGVQ